MNNPESSGTRCSDGHLNQAGQHFCGECGKPIVGEGPPTAETDGEPKATRRFLRPKVLVPIAVLAIVAVVGIVLLTRDSSPEPHSIIGILTLTDTDEFWSEGDPCAGSGGYDDIQEGAQVTVKDENGHVLATSDLLEGVAASDYECDFAFAIPDVPEARFYAVEISHRGEITNSRRDLERNDWFVGLTLGD